MKILIVGDDLNAVLLAKYAKIRNHDAYVTTEDKDDSYTSVNIKPNDIDSICDFVKYNQIEFTVVTSQLAIINGIADLFNKEGFTIFAPFAEAARVTFFNSIAKKIMYKLKIPTPKFGIFDRENLAIEYTRNSKFPVVIENDFTLFQRELEVCNTFSKAKNSIMQLFESGNEKIIIENYIEEKPLYLYFVTDGYNALPLIALERNLYEEYSDILAPSSKITDKVIIFILQHTIYPLLDDISKFVGSYTGIIGMKIKIRKNMYFVLEFYNGFQSYDLQAFLSLLQDDFINIMYNAANHVLMQNRNYIELSPYSSYTVSINKNEFNTFEDNDYIYSFDENNYIITDTALTLNLAKKNIINFVKENCNDKISANILKLQEQEELKI